MKKRSLSIRGKLFLISIVLFITTLLVFNYYNLKIRPIVEIMAVSKIEDVATEVINNSVLNELNREDISYEELVRFEKDSSGYITAIKTDAMKINKLKAKIATVVMTQSEIVEKEEIFIPIGSLLNIEMFSGFGPNVPIKMVPAGNVFVNITQNFTEAGINQTRHQIMLTVTMSADVILPSKTSFAEYSSDFIIAETIIVGKVPQSYFTLDAISRSVKDKVLYLN